MKCDDDADQTRRWLIDQSHGQIDWLKLITCQGHMTWIDWYVTFDWHCKMLQNREMLIIIIPTDIANIIKMVDDAMI